MSTGFYSFKAPKMLNRLRATLAGAKIAKSAEIRNLQRISLGRKVVIEANCTLQGGEEDRFRLLVGDNCRFRKNAYVSARRGNISIGSDCYFAHNDWVGGQGKITIGSNSIFGPNVVIISSNHDLNYSSGPRFSFPEVLGSIKIESNVWIGANVSILPNVSIGENAVIGAGSVVTSDVAENCLALGNPAKPVKKLEPGERTYLLSE